MNDAPDPVPPSSETPSPTGEEFICREIDGTPWLEESYRLRYRTYCLERRYMDPAACPDGLERDEYDAQSVHVGLISRSGELVGTFRLVTPGLLGAPLFRRCAVDRRARPWLERPGPELSRFLLNAAWVRRASETGGDRKSEGPSGPGSRLERRKNPGLALMLVRGVYHLCKRRGDTFFFMATDKFFSRLLNQYRIPHLTIGPPVDYFGQVQPFVIQSDDFERAIAQTGPDMVAWWREGLTEEPVEVPSGSAVRSPPAAEDERFEAERLHRGRVLVDAGGLTDSFVEQALRLGFQHLTVVSPEEAIDAEWRGAVGDARSPFVRLETPPGPDEIAALVGGADVIFHSVDYVNWPATIQWHDECRRQSKTIFTAWPLGPSAVVHCFPPGSPVSFRTLFGLPPDGPVRWAQCAQAVRRFLESMRFSTKSAVVADVVELLSKIASEKPFLAPPAGRPSPAGAFAADIARKVLLGESVPAAPETILLNRTWWSTSAS